MAEHQGYVDQAALEASTKILDQILAAPASMSHSQLKAIVQCLVIDSINSCQGEGETRLLKQQIMRLVEEKRILRQRLSKQAVRREEITRLQTVLTERNATIKHLRHVLSTKEGFE